MPSISRVVRPRETRAEWGAPARLCGRLVCVSDDGCFGEYGRGFSCPHMIYGTLAWLFFCAREVEGCCPGCCFPRGVCLFAATFKPQGLACPTPCGRGCCFSCAGVLAMAWLWFSAPMTLTRGVSGAHGLGGRGIRVRGCEHWAPSVSTWAGVAVCLCAPTGLAVTFCVRVWLHFVAPCVHLALIGGGRLRALASKTCAWKAGCYFALANPCSRTTIALTKSPASDTASDVRQRVRCGRAVLAWLGCCSCQT